MKRIILVRHGETYQNRDHVVQGQDPTRGKLTEEGIMQAMLLGKALGGESFDVAYTSTLERAVLTLSLVLIEQQGPKTVPIRFADELREIDQGVLNGRTHEDWKGAITGDPMAWRPEGGESWLDVQERVTRYLHDVILADEHRSILIVAHGGVNRGLLSSLLGFPMSLSWQGPGVGTPQSNTCCNRLHVKDNGTVAFAEINDTSHLEGHEDFAGRGQRWNVKERKWELLGPPAETYEASFLAS